MTSPSVVMSPSLSMPSAQPASSIDPIIIRNIIDEAFRVKTDKQGRITPSTKQIGYELFVSRFEPCLLIDAFATVIEQFPVVAAECPKYNSWWTPRFYHLIFLIAQAFMTVLASERAPNKTKEKNRKQDSFSNVHVNVTDEQRCRILKDVVSLNFSFDSNFWTLADYVLNFNKCPKDVVTIISDAASIGKASFSAVDYCIRNKVLSRYFDDPAILYSAALLGPLRAGSVESFAAKRGEEFRQRCREVLLRVEKLAGSPKEWERAIVEYLGSVKQNDSNGRVVAYTYVGFRNSFSTLMRDLRGLPPSDDRINVRWAHQLVKKCAAKYYCEKTWKIENLHEVIWTILAQRPSMRKFVVQTLSKDFNDPQGAEMWRICKIPADARKHMSHKSKEEHLDPRTPNPPYLSLPESVEPIEFVRHPSHLKRVANLLEDYANDSFPPVGVDAEWSSYVSYSKATILQLAIPYHIFIIDVDEIKSDILVVFFEKLFVEWKLLKIGYQFDEDLIQLRSAVQRCSALYHPKNLICIGKLVKLLMKESAQRPEINLDGVFHSEKVQTSERSTDGIRTDIISTEMDGNTWTYTTDCKEDAKERMNFVSVDILQAVNKSDDVASTSTVKVEEVKGSVTSEQKEQHMREKKKEENPLLKEIRGLSALCKRVLGKPLDKTEQCSVWDRRPLRDLQLRYAALDAYCMLMLYEKCVDWASRLDLNINEICSKQEPLTGTLPLFCDKQ
ncbi:3'-5' exonuclease [Loa loa]|uniref:3'-5' exonuclease n=1 Tax=Loa loa TaxID=7209 RepID=A0A1I7W2F9_LOALO|nr:3'-5' exonuclease [Loa loa]EJD74851.1 3'-5' exonuclease [Loa loa]